MLSTSRILRLLFIALLAISFAVGCGGGDSSGAASSGGPAAPSAPAVPAAMTGDAQVSLTWAGVDGASGYRVYFNLDAAGALSRASSPSQDTAGKAQLTISALQNGAKYRFAVTARNDGGESDLSPEVSVTPSADVALSVVSSEPTDGSSGVSLRTPIKVAFNKAVAPATVTVSTSGTTCSGSLQLSSDQFATCVALAGMPAASSFDKVFAVSTASPLTPGLTYKVRVTTGVTDASGAALKAAFTSAMGFTTDTQFSVVSTSPGDAATNVTLGTPIAVTFTKTASVASITTNVGNTACSGSVQVSNDGFATCVAMAAMPMASAGNTTFTLQPAMLLASQATYKIRVTTSAADANGNALAAQYVTPMGFTTVGGFLVSGTTPLDGATSVSENTPISVTFTKPANVASITTSTTGTACNGAIQLSPDNFATCVAMNAMPVASNGNQTFTVTPQVALLSMTPYRIRVTTAAEDTTNTPLTVAFTSPTGFTTRAPFAVASTNPSDTGTTNVPDMTAIQVLFNKPADPTTITTTTGGTACAGSFQVSKDNFATCVQMAGAPAGSMLNMTFTVIPAAALGLSPATTYKVRVTTAAKDANEVPLATVYTSGAGFTTQ